MKIGILTFHYSINIGSVLQAYCVYKLFKQGLPQSQVEIINLVPYNRELNEWNFIGRKSPFIKLNSIKRYAAIRHFIKYNTELSKRAYYRNLSSQIKFINKQGYDYVVTGSDTVWMHSSKLGGMLPTIYFLPTQIEAKKMSVAASVDPLVDTKPYYDNKEELKNVFDNYSIISVRDKLTENLLRQIGIAKVSQIADPTIIHDFETDFKIPTNKVDRINKKRVLVWASDKELDGLIKQYISDLLNAEFVSVHAARSGKQSYVFDDLALYCNVDIVITDRFHRSIFALKLSNALVINIERASKNPLPISKGRDLFENIGIADYCIRYEKGNEKDFEQKLINLVHNYSKDTFDKREELINKYIAENKNKWKKLTSEILRE